MRPTRALLLLPLLVAPLACGDDDEGLSAEQYTAEANQICEEGGERTDDIASELSADSSEDEIRTVMQDYLDEVQAQIDDIDELEGPDDLEGDVQAALDDADEVIEDLRERIEDDVMAVVESEEDPFAEVNAALDEAGITACSAE